MAGWRGLPAGDLSIPMPPCTSLPWGAAFADRGWAVSGPVRHRFIFPGGGTGGAVQGAGAFGGQGRPGDERRNPVPLSSCLLLPVSAPPGPALARV